MTKAHYGLVEAVAGVNRLPSAVSPPEDASGSLEELPTRGWSIWYWRGRANTPGSPLEKLFVSDAITASTLPNSNEVPAEPFDFFQAASSFLAPGLVVRSLKSPSGDFEGELGVVMARQCYQLAQTKMFVPTFSATTCVNDMTARDLQNKDRQWTRAKGFDTFCPVGPLITDEIDPWGGNWRGTRVNGAVRQRGNTRISSSRSTPSFATSRRS